MQYCKFTQHGSAQNRESRFMLIVLDGCCRYLLMQIDQYALLLGWIVVDLLHLVSRYTWHCIPQSNKCWHLINQHLLCLCPFASGSSSKIMATVPIICACRLLSDARIGRYRVKTFKITRINLKYFRFEISNIPLFCRKYVVSRGSSFVQFLDNYWIWKCLVSHHVNLGVNKLYD